ncbi:ATP-grasp fold amidoligase family protein [Piscibacillus halophilus]|uniref:ATP-grasp fold amidoligase family protein n=1 Tax=Piscibacillus halophilus TaxID=571933 RepID=UPI0024097B8C|nr:ATP-grasp fold amidoligase family protein [Piscibacillus halophilus]
MNNQNKQHKADQNTSPLLVEKEKEVNLSRSLYELEREIEQLNLEIKHDEKVMKNMQKSPMWKVAKWFQKLKSVQKTNQYQIKELEDQIQSLKALLYTTKSELNLLNVNDRQLNTYKIMQMLAEEHHRGNLLQYLSNLIEQKELHDQNYKNTLHHAARLLMKGKEDYQKVAYDQILNALKTEDIPEFMVRSGFKDKPVSLSPAASFRASLTMRMRQQQLTQSLPEWPLDQKELAYQFVDQFDVRRPYTDDMVYSLDKIPTKDGIVIKPEDGAGSRGVYLVHSSTKIADIKRNQTLFSIEQLKKHMEQDLNSGWVESDQWKIEELIYEDQTQHIPARDIKFYCFYGKVALILEITRYPELQYCWWTRDGQPIKTGKYEHELFKGEGVDAEELKMVEELSLNIPAPFLRIDFLKSEDGLVFGEFTPKPGNYDEFSDEIDEWLGNEYLEADNRLTHDLLNGKKFRLLEDKNK